jgi:CubicO group peptidase (beta-lactamase class C family)
MMTIPISRPSQQGVAPEAITAFIDALENDPLIEPHALIIQRHGHRIAEGYWAPHTPDRSRLVYSLSKTFTGTALALLLGEGKLTLDDLVSDHLPEFFEGADERTKRMRIRHIASMASGHDREMMGEATSADRDDPVRGFFTIPPDEEPGTLFAYNQPPVLALATILQRLAGQRLVDYLRPRVFDPMGIGDVRWTQHRPGIDLGFSGVHTNLDAIARLGQLHLNDGTCDGRRLLPEGWVTDASRVQTPNPQRVEPDWRQGYGFQLWMSRHGYRGDGAFGQYMVVLPEHDAVVAMFSCNEDMQRVLDLMWKHLVPAMGTTTGGPGAAADDGLAVRLAGLTMPTAAERLGGGPLTLPPMRLHPGEAGPTAHRTIEAIEATTHGTGDRIVLHERNGITLEVPLTLGWTSVPGASIAASATVLPDGHAAVDLVLLDTPHRLELALDPARATFAATWPVMPLFMAGVEKHLSSIRAPD